MAAETAEEMARGVAQRCAARYGLAATGVAGPEAQDGHPVGEVFVGLGRLRSPTRWPSEEHRLSRKPVEIRCGTAELALCLLAEQLRARIERLMSRSRSELSSRVSTVSVCDRDR